MGIIISIAIIQLCVLIPVAIILLIIYLIYKYERKKKNQNIQIKEKYEIKPNFPYYKKELLTNNEKKFYRIIKQLAKKYDIETLIKVRMADLIECKKGMNKKDWGKYFGKIKAKHVDFVLIKNEDVILIIELDDYTHKWQNRMNRDKFVDEALKGCNYKIIHTYGDTKEIEEFLEKRYDIKYKE